MRIIAINGLFFWILYGAQAFRSLIYGLCGILNSCGKRQVTRVPFMSLL